MFPASADFGSSSIFSTVFEQTPKSNWRMTEESATLASRSANRIAMQERGPCPKPKYVYLKKENENTFFKKLFYLHKLGKMDLKTVIKSSKTMSSDTLIKHFF